MPNLSEVLHDLDQSHYIVLTLFNLACRHYIEADPGVLVAWYDCILSTSCTAVIAGVAAVRLFNALSHCGL